MSDDQPTAPFNRIPYPSAQDAAAPDTPSAELPETDTPADPGAEETSLGWRARRRAQRERESVTEDGATQVIPIGPAHDDTPPRPADAPAELEPGSAPHIDVPPALASSPRELRRQRRRLVGARDEMIFHLGGLAYELHLQGELQPSVAQYRAGLIYELDSTLEAIDAQLTAKGRSAGDGKPLAIVVGSCRTCRTRFVADARYCMTCGALLAPPEHRHPESSSSVSGPTS